MKKILAMLSLFFLAACGSGGGASVSNPADVTASTPTGVLQVTFAPQSDTAHTLAATPAKHVRVVVSNNNLRYNGEAYKVIQDASPGGSLAFALPVSAGYTIEAITYITDASTGLNVIQQYAVANGVAVGLVNSSTTLSLVDVAVKFVLPDVVQGSRYSVQANYSTAAGRRVTPLSTSWYMPPPQMTPFTGFTNDTTATSLTTTLHTFTAPFPGIAGASLYLQGVFTMKQPLLKADENPKQWVFNYPNPNVPQFSVPIETPVNLTITVPNF